MERLRPLGEVGVAIPTIYLNDLNAILLRSPADSGAPATSQRVLAQLRSAATREGFFYLAGWDAAYLEGILGATRRFFELSQADKHAIALSRQRHFRGYSCLGQEITGGIRDHKEVLDLGPEGYARLNESAGFAYDVLRGPNQWPQAQPELAKIFTIYMNKLQVVGWRLLQALGQALALSFETVASAAQQDPFYLLRLIHYPSVPQSAASKAGGEGTGAGPGQGVGAHTDFGFLVMLLQDDVGGLEVCSQQGTWLPVPPMPGALVVNFGDVMAAFTGGLVRATPHRVHSPSGDRSRFSVPFFLEPDLAAKIAAPGSDRSEISYGEHILAAFERSFPSSGIAAT